MKQLNEKRASVAVATNNLETKSPSHQSSMTTNQVDLFDSN